ncbi:MAG: alpha/beta fold hydrolase [Gammaproteobacteria bacterium]|nr:alpha/beta fold hydrolase [Gammaproteobacteria bacterium]
MSGLWIPTSQRQLMQAQSNLLARFVKTPYQSSIITVPFDGKGLLHKPQSVEINYVDNAPERTDGHTLIIAHGWGSGLGFYFANLDLLAQQFDRVIAFDWLGFGGSSRPSCRNAPKLRRSGLCLTDTAFSAPVEAIDFFIKPFEQFVDALALDRPFTLLGHSLGGYLCARYGVKHPDKLKRLMLASPAGFPPRPPEQYVIPKDQLPFGLKLIDSMWHRNFTPGQIIRALGRLGPRLTHSILNGRFGKRWGNAESKLIAEYLYHISAATGSGEYAMNSLLEPVMSQLGSTVYAREPFAPLLPKMGDVPVDIAYGDRDWLFSEIPVKLAAQSSQKQGVKLNLTMIPQAGHHLYLDNTPAFHRWIQA